MKIKKSDVGRFAKVSDINNPKKIFRAIIVDAKEFNDEMLDVFDMRKKKVTFAHFDQIVSLGSRVKLPTRANF